MGQFLGIGGSAPPLSPPLLPAMLPEKLRRRLLASLPSDEDGLLAVGFEHFEDHRKVQGHRYMEGFFHAVSGAHGSAVPSVHPRFGCELERQPAPLPLAAFCEGFRRANAQLFTAIERRLSKQRTAGPLAEALRSGRHIADLSVQVHWGDGIQPEHVSWHIDAPNSYLHLAIGLQGRRALHKRERSCPEPETCWQEEGAMYLSSPCTFPHAVEYPEVDWDNRIVAVQCRLLLSSEDMFGQTNRIDQDHRGGTAAAVFQPLAALGSLHLPSLDEVAALEAELAAAAE